MISDVHLQEILGPEGAIARNHPNYEFRPGQIKMAQAVSSAIDDRRHLCVEAGTGTGKTLAYLIPTLFCGKRVIISTGTKNLQEQLYLKDIPFLEKALGRKFSVCYMKGRSNYLCLRRLAEIEGESYLFSPRDPQYLKTIRGWARKTDTGDRAELKNLPEEIALWRHLDAGRETCLGQKCADFDGCFVTRVRQRSLESDIVIVNHHLFFADLALRQGDFGSVLPEYSVVIFDEAHEIEDVATQYFGFMVSNYRMEELARDSEKALAEAGSASAYLMRQLEQLSTRAAEFFNNFRGREGKHSMLEFDSGMTIRRGPPHGDALGDAYRALQTTLAVVQTGLANSSVKSDVLEALVRRAGEIREELGLILESESTERVYWYELRNRGVFLWASPIKVSSILSEKLFAAVDSIVLTSATLSTDGNFQFIRSRLGLENADELILGSHFDFEKQALFYVPLNIAEPRERAWVEQACVELERILAASRGRAFLLFTSYNQMGQVYETLKGRLRFPMLMQGSMSKSGLLEAFRELPNSVLFATSSFWQGVDVQGEKLSCVVIDKLPFSVPSDPVVAARIRYINECGGNPFYEYQIPEAIILLKQGIGRLIRSKTDRGILALLDKRILTKQYGQMFLRSLPPAPLTNDKEALRNFL
ncbi:MAG: helicase c2 [Acidobacteria bacterium]|nr:helicase c2 [Acidobacteriota bacterium]